MPSVPRPGKGCNMPFRKAVFYVSHRPGCAEIALDCAARLTAHGVCVTAPDEYCAEEVRTALGAQPEAAAIDGADVAVVIGGDGSILRAARALAPRGVPILGVNMGRIGFMSELEPTELDAIDAMCRGDYETEERMMLRTTVRRGEELLLDAHSLNDVTVNRAENHKLIELDIWSDAQFISKFRADGVIVATPTGSTAYSMSAGGPILEPTLHNLTITPICAQGLYTKSFVLAPNRRVSIRIADGHRGAILTPDGHEGVRVSAGDEIIVSQSPYTTRLVRIKGKSVYEIIRDKLNIDHYHN